MMKELVVEVVRVEKWWRFPFSDVKRERDEIGGLFFGEFLFVFPLSIDLPYFAVPLWWFLVFFPRALVVVLGFYIGCMVWWR